MAAYLPQPKGQFNAESDQQKAVDPLLHGNKQQATQCGKKALDTLALTP